VRQLLLAALFLATPAAAQDAANGQGAVLRALDKVNGDTVDVQIMTGQSIQIFSLFVDVADCRYPAGNPSGDAFAFLRIAEDRGGADLFSGWMIASSPALSALDHSRYDVWVLRCITS
jgi:hypothetical protein